MKSYEDLHADYLNALAMLDHMARCYGVLLEHHYREKTGGYHRSTYQGMETLQ